MPFLHCPRDHLVYYGTHSPGVHVRPAEPTLLRRVRTAELGDIKLDSLLIDNRFDMANKRQHWLNKAALMTAGAQLHDVEHSEPSPDVVRELNAQGWRVLKIGGSLLQVTRQGLVEIDAAVPAEFVLVPT
jgi:hypothetical protein